MERCVLGATQNQNESFNALIWGRCPKTEFHSTVVVEIATHLAVITFNSGKEAFQTVLEELRLPCGSTTLSYLQELDKERIWQAEHKGKELVKKRQRQVQLDRVTTEEEQLAAEGFSMNQEDSEPAVNSPPTSSTSPPPLPSSPPPSTGSSQSPYISKDKFITCTYVVGEM